MGEPALIDRTKVEIIPDICMQRGRIPFDVVSDEVAAKTQESIDKFWAEKKWGVNEINSILDEHF